ncbi:MAG: RNA polymerase sigma factor [Bacillota bacterium]
MEIEILVRNAKAGDKDALVQLIMAQKQEYYKLAFVYMKNRDDALDAMDDMIIKLYENIHKLRKDECFYSWSRTILVNRCKMLIKKRSKVIPVERLKEADTAAYTENTEELAMLESCMSKLDIKHREVIKLRFYMDMDYQSIADLLKVPLGTVKSRIHCAIVKLKGLFGGEDYEEA